MKRQDIAAMCRLVDSLGAEVLLNVAEPMPRSRAEKVEARTTIEQEVTVWHETAHCTCQPGPHEPSTPEWANSKMPREGSVAIIGPNPTHAWKQSRAERMLYDALRRGGLDMSQTSWIHACWCVPLADGRVRAPNAAELEAWHGWTLRALDAADAQYVLLHGALATRTFRRDLPVSTDAMYVWGNRWWTRIIPHASNVLRRDGIPETPWRESVGAFASQVTENVTWEALGNFCIKCAEPVYMWDADGVAFCKTHLNTDRREHARRVNNKSIQRTFQQKAIS